MNKIFSKLESSVCCNECRSEAKCKPQPLQGDVSDKKKKDLLNFSAGGFKDFTRIGSSDPQMWSDIFLKNKKHLLKTLNDFNQDLETLKKFIQKMDEKSIIKLLKKTKEIRKQILKVEKNFDR